MRIANILFLGGSWKKTLMIDIILLTWIVWGILVGRQTHLYFLVGDIVAVVCVILFYKTIATIDISVLDIDAYKEKIIELYVWLEPLQSVQIHSKANLAIAIDLFAYVILLVVVLAAIAVFRNVIAAFSIYQVTGTILNASIGGLRNALLVVIGIVLLPEALFNTYWIFELTRDSMIFSILR